MNEEFLKSFQKHAMSDTEKKRLALGGAAATGLGLGLWGLGKGKAGLVQWLTNDYIRGLTRTAKKVK